MNWKYHACIIAAISITSLCNGQISEPFGELLFEDTITFDPLHDWISIPSQAEDVWQIGNSNKSILYSSLSNKPIIITDTILGYPMMADDWFFLNIGQDDLYPSWFEGILSFNHKFHTDSLLDGGFVEISYDGGTSWKNILYDKNQVVAQFIGLYTQSDTIDGGIPAFTGTSNEWIYTEFHWVWYALTKKTTNELDGWPILRFRFVSDSIDSGKDGWLIDQIVFRGYDISGTVKNHFKGKQIVFPNPFHDLIYVSLQKDGEISVFRLYSLNGNLQLYKEINESELIDVTSLPQGFYYFSITRGNKILETGKLVKN